MYTKKRININCYSVCQLDCRECLKSQDGLVPHFDMDMGEFIDIVDKCVEYGFRTFELTPPYGDPLLDKDILRRVKYISERGVDEVFFYTNLLALTPMVLMEMSNIPNFNFRISVYGDTYESYYKHTGKHYFYDFIDKLKMLNGFLSQNPEFDKVSELSMRFNGFRLRNLGQVTNPLYRELAKMVLSGRVDMPDDSGIDEYSINTNDLVKVREDINTEPHMVYNRRGICPMSVWDNGVYANGDITLCKWCDRNGKLIIGNLFKQGLEEIYSPDSLYMKIIEEQKNGKYRSLCGHCNIFDSEHYKKELIF